MIVLATLLSAADAAFAGPFSQGPSGDELVNVRLVIEEAGATPGATVHLGVVFEMEPGWHIYWRNSGDTGYPPAITLDLPEGVTAGEIQWPAPQRYEHTGLVDHIYEGVVTLIVPLRIDSAYEGDWADIRAKVDWLVCKEECLPGARDVSTRLKVARDVRAIPLNADVAPLFAAARAQAPRSSGEAHRNGVRMELDGRTVIITAPGAESITFFSFEPRKAPPIRAARDTFVKGDTMRVEYDNRIDRAERISGVVRIRINGAESIYFLETPGPAA